MTLTDLRRLMAEPEDAVLEFKTARNTFSADEALRYLCALANEGGGHLVLGVSDRPPREIVGSRAFRTIDEHLSNWVDALRRPVRYSEVFDGDCRVIVFEVDARPAGEYVMYKGVPYVRRGESLVQMTADRMKEIALEATDTSDRAIPGLTAEMLDRDAVEVFRDGAVTKAPRETLKRRYRAMDVPDLLGATGLRSASGHLNEAALLILGTEQLITEHLRRAEIIFEYRADPEALRPARRIPLREPLVLGIDELLSEILPIVRADPIESVQGTRVAALPRYTERSIREALLNAAAHRDYTDTRPVEVFLSPEALVVKSPGRFPEGVTPENVADQRIWRNRALADGLNRCGLIEQSGLGVNLMMAAAVHQAQPLPTFEEPEQSAVRVTLHGESTPHMLRFTQQRTLQEWEDTPSAALRAVDAIRRNVPLARINPTGAAWLLSRGIVQRTREGYLRPADPYLAAIPPRERRLFGFGGLQDALVAELAKHAPVGLSMPEIDDLFVDHDRKQIRRLLSAMRGERVRMTGRTKAARWHALAVPPQMD